ncbi:MAG: hypothetical protein HY360_18215 [Verrucomicrobia bacterium]|nr:hypothetical protein [Verrucomicrobiota bacterium]
MKLFEVDLPAHRVTARPSLKLDGEWSYLVDPRTAGIEATEEMFDPNRLFPGRIRLPGCWQALTGKAAAQAFRYNPRERVWYRRRCVIPATWKGRRIWLRLGGVMPAGELWVNGQCYGATASSRCPLRADLTAFVRYGEENDIAIKLFYPSMRLDGTFTWINGGWEGLYRSVFLEASPSNAIADVLIDADTERGVAAAHIVVRRERQTRSDPFRLRLSVWTGKRNRMAVVKEGLLSDRNTSLEIPFSIRALPRWSPESPTLCTARLELILNGRICDWVEVPFGLRSLRVQGDRILLNGRAIILRGYGTDQIYPATIAPPCSVDFFRRHLRQAKSYGFNLVSAYDLFTEEFLEAADEVGMIVMQTMPFGFTNPLRSERNSPRPEWQAFLRVELDHIVRAQRNHPSLGCITMGSELSQREQNRDSFRLFCQELPRLARCLAPHVLVMDINEGQGNRLKTDHGRRVTDLCEILYFNDALRYKAKPATDRPAICHEYAWWSSYPDIRKRKLYKNRPMYPYWLDEAEMAARRAGLLSQLPRFVANSRKIQALLRKEGLEKARLHGFAGYILWLYQDTMWATEGIVDDFGHPHPGLTSRALHRCNGETIVIWDDANQRTFEAGQVLLLSFAVAGGGQKALKGLELEVSLFAGGRRFFTRTLPVPVVSPASVARLRPVNLILPHVPCPVVMEIRTRLLQDSRQVAENQWRSWVFPPADPTSDSRIVLYGSDDPALKTLFGKAVDQVRADDGLVVSVNRMDETVIGHLKRGARVLLLSDGVLPNYEIPDTDIFRTVPWNRGCTGHSGTVIEPHPSLGDFPHDGFCDYSFVDLVIGGWPEERTWPFNLDALNELTSQPIKPVIRLIDHYRSARNKTYLFELQVGRGKLLATCLRFRWGIQRQRPEARHLLRCLTRYALSDKFRPRAKVRVGDFIRGFKNEK